MLTTGEAVVVFVTSGTKAKANGFSYSAGVLSFTNLSYCPYPTYADTVTAWVDYSVSTGGSGIQFSLINYASAMYVYLEVVIVAATSSISEDANSGCGSGTSATPASSVTAASPDLLVGYVSAHNTPECSSGGNGATLMGLYVFTVDTQQLCSAYQAFTSSGTDTVDLDFSTSVTWQAYFIGLTTSGGIAMPSIVNEAYCGVSGTTCTTPSVTVASGDTVIATGNDGPPSSVRDSFGDVISSGVACNKIYLYYDTSAHVGSDTFTVLLPSSVTAGIFIVFVVANALAVNAESSCSSGTSTTTHSVTFTTTTADTLVIGAWFYTGTTASNGTLNSAMAQWQATGATTNSSAVAFLPDFSSGSVTIESISKLASSYHGLAIALGSTPGSGPVTGLSVTGTTVASESLAWTNPSGVTNLSVWVGLSPTVFDVAHYSIPGTDTSYTAGPLASNVTYYFEIWTWYSGSLGSVSSVVNGRTYLAAHNLRVVSVHPTTADLAWVNPTSGKFTNITLFGTFPGSPDSLGMSLTSYDLTGLAPGTTYTAQLRSWDGIFDGNTSDAVTFTTLLAPVLNLTGYLSYPPTTAILWVWEFPADTFPTGPGYALANVSVDLGFTCSKFVREYDIAPASEFVTPSLVAGTKYCAVVGYSTYDTDAAEPELHSALAYANFTTQGLPVNETPKPQFIPTIYNSATTAVESSATLGTNAYVQNDRVYESMVTKTHPADSKTMYYETTFSNVTDPASVAAAALRSATTYVNRTQGCGYGWNAGCLGSTTGPVVLSCDGTRIPFLPSQAYVVIPDACWSFGIVWGRNFTTPLTGLPAIYNITRVDSFLTTQASYWHFHTPTMSDTLSANLTILGPSDYGTPPVNFSSLFGAWAISYPSGQWNAPLTQIRYVTYNESVEPFTQLATLALVEWITLPPGVSNFLVTIFGTPTTVHVVGGQNATVPSSVTLTITNITHISGLTYRGTVSWTNAYPGYFVGTFILSGTWATDASNTSLTVNAQPTVSFYTGSGVTVAAGTLNVSIGQVENFVLTFTSSSPFSFNAPFFIFDNLGVSVSLAIGGIGLFLGVAMSFVSVSRRSRYWAEVAAGTMLLVGTVAVMVAI